MSIRQLLGTSTGVFSSRYLTAFVTQKGKTGDDRIAFKGGSNSGIMVITDGVGSLPNSAECAHTLSTHFLNRPLPISHTDITRELHIAQNSYSDNGATATLVAAIHNRNALITSIGDPQAFLFNTKGILKAQTHPHYIPSKHTSAISKHHFPTGLSHHHWKLEKGDLLIACTDGIGDNITLAGVTALACHAITNDLEYTFRLFNEVISLFLEAPNDSSGEIMRASRDLASELNIIQHVPATFKKDDRSMIGFRIF
jgi:hypothetical protein